ncbi:hypothetical protein [Lapidilactobacillus salsurivasis]
MRFSAHFQKAQSDAHSELTPNFAAQAADNIETSSPTQPVAKRN